MLPDFLRDRYLRRAVVLWAIFAAAYCGKTIYLTRVNSVFPQFEAASRHWWADRSLYANYVWTEGLDGYRYSPTFAVAITPLARLHYRAGATLWGLACIAVLFYALHALVRDVLPDRWTPRREGLFLSLALAGYAVGIWSGQTNALLSALILLAMSAIMRGRWWTAAWLLAVPVFIKLWPLAVVVLLAVCWPRQLSLRFAVACLVLAAAPLATRPFSVVRWQYHEWYLCLTGPLQDRWPGYRDAWTIWNSVWPPVNHRAYTALQLATAAAVLAWCLGQRRRLLSLQKGTGSVASFGFARRRRFGATVPVPFCNRKRGLAPSHHSGSSGEDGATRRCLSPFASPHTGRLLLLIYAIWASWQLLFGPGSEQLTYGIVAPAMCWALLTSFAERKARWLTLPAFLMSVLMASGDVEKAVSAVFSRADMLLPLSVALFVAWLLWHERGEVACSYVPQP